MQYTSSLLFSDIEIILKVNKKEIDLIYSALRLAEQEWGEPYCTQTKEMADFLNSIINK